MPRSCSIQDDPHGLGVLITSSYGLDRDWVDDAECRKYMLGRAEDERNPWHASKNDDIIDGVNPAELVKAAKMICYGCPAQYACANYAGQGMMVGGTWGGLDQIDLRWLQKQPDIEAVCEKAQHSGEAMQTYVKRIRLYADFSY